MKTTLLITALLCLIFTYTSAQQIWKFCPGDRSKDLLTVSNVVINPATPKSGAPLAITLQGQLNEAIDGDSYLDVDVSYSGVQLFQGQVKVCSPDFLNCPVPAGKLDQTFTQNVPAFAPPGGPYTGTARLADAQGNNFTCITFDFMMDSAAETFKADEPAIDDEFVAAVNSKATTWKAGKHSIFEGKSLAHVQKFYLGARLNPVTIDQERQYQKAKSVKALPAHFDWRTDSSLGHCIHPIRNQEKCGSCWAFAGSEALSDRFCIQSKGSIDVVLSPQYLVSCDTGDMGCNGGYLQNAWEWMHKHGLPTDKCMPYKSQDGSVEACPKKCQDGTEPKFYKAKNVNVIRGGASEIQQEIYTNGPVEVGFSVYRDFLTYTGGVYRHTSGALLGGHAVKMVGWGVTSQNVPYWIVANSWGESWGQAGFFWIYRGHNECGIESNAVAGNVEL